MSMNHTQFAKSLLSAALCATFLATAPLVSAEETTSTASTDNSVKGTLERAADKTGAALNKGAEKTKEGLTSAAQHTEHGLKTAAEHTGNALHTAADKTEHALQKTGEKIKEVMVGDDKNQNHE